MNWLATTKEPWEGYPYYQIPCTIETSEFNGRLGTLNGSDHSQG